MLVAARNRFLSLFSGYLHIPADPLRLQADPNPNLRSARSADGHNDTPPREDPRQAIDDLAIGRSPLHPEIPPDPWNLPNIQPLRLRPPPHVAVKPTIVPPGDPDDHFVGMRGGGGGMSLIRVEYRDGGNQVDLRADQINRLRDADNFQAGDGAHNADASDTAVEALLSEAAAQVPAVYLGETDAPEAAAATLMREAHHANSDGPTSLPEGVTVNGQTLSADPTDSELPSDPTLSPPALPVDHAEDVSVIEAGSNLALNSGQIVDTQGTVGTLIVLGDSYTSDAIVQINVLVDESAIQGDVGAAELHVMGNSTDNVAEFVRVLEDNPYAQAHFAGLRWNVDRIDGDYYDVKLLRQFNDIGDGDVVRQTASDHYQLAATGANDLINESVVLHGGKQYDLVIVGGDYIGINWILQTNVLLNSDAVVLATGEGGAGGLIVSTGANWLINSATIIDYTQGAEVLTPEVKAIADALMQETATLDPVAGTVIPGDGSMVLNVLFITGDYYNMNILEQTNVIADSDTVSQSLSAGEDGFVSTGSNVAANEALLINLGPLGGQYVGGSQYSEAVLVQTNIITQSADLPPGSTTGANPNELAPEAVAFIQHAPMRPHRRRRKPSSHHHLMPRRSLVPIRSAA